MDIDKKNKYISGAYLHNNPDWHTEDSEWKAKIVVATLTKNNIQPTSICEIGCGAGYVLSTMRSFYPKTALNGFDISPSVKAFWGALSQKNISFVCGDFHKINQAHYDLIMLLDVIEHVHNPWEFLVGLHGQAKWYVFHVPLEFTALGAIRERPLLHARIRVGHIHYFTPNLVLSLLHESGYEVVSHEFTQAFRSAPNRSFKTRLVNIPRCLISRFDKSLSARLLGGDTLLVLAKSAKR